MEGGLDTSRGGGGIPPWAHPRVVWAAGLSVLALLAVVLVVWRAREVVGWLGMALLLALTLGEAARGLQRLHLSRGTAIAVVLTAAVAAFVALVVFVVPRTSVQARALVEHLPAFAHRIDRAAQVPWLTGHLAEVRALGDTLASQAGDAAGSLLHLLKTAWRTVFATVTVFVLAAYMLVSGPALIDGIVSWLPAPRRPRWEAIITHARWAVGRYVTAMLSRAVLLAAAATVMLALLHVPYYLPLGLVLTLLGVLPVVGAILGTVVVTAAAAAAAGPRAGLIALALYVAFQQADSHLLAPLFQRYTLQMNPLITVLAGLVGITAGGVLGAALALPLAAVVQVVMGDLRGEPRPAGGTPAPAPAPAPTLSEPAASHA